MLFDYSIYTAKVDRHYRRWEHDTFIHSTPKSYGMAIQVKRKKKKKR